MKYIIKLGRAVLQLVYQTLQLFPVENKITMISRQSNTPSVDFTLLQKEFKSRSNKVKVVMLCKTLDGAAKANFYDKMTYFFHMFVQMYHMATSRVVLLDTYCILASLLHHRTDLQIVQMWHSMGTMKLFGYTAIGSKEGRSESLAEIMHMHDNYNYFIAASKQYRNHLAEGFRCDPDKCFICPLPRYDLLKSDIYKEKKCEEIYSRHPELKKNKIILYCPTFRQDETGMKQALDELIRYIPEGFELIVKLHPLSQLSVSGKNIWTLDEFSTFDVLFIADYIISDYSCVIYEAGIRGLPLSFYTFDLTDYYEARGLAISLKKDVAGVISSDPQVIMNAIRENDFDMDAIRLFIDKYIEKTENATGKLTDFLIRIGRITVE